VRRRLALLAVAIASLVLVAFLIPLGLLVRTVAADRAVNAATSQVQSLVPLVTTADKATLRLTLEQLNGTAAHPFTVFLADGPMLGAPAARTAAVRLAATGRSFTVATGGGRQILVSVQGPGGTSVIATFVSSAELRHGVTRAWLVLLVLGAALVVAGVVVADRLAQAMIRPISELSAVSRRLAGGDLAARARPAGPPEIRDVAAALNYLAARIGDLLRAEREAAADLSHRLRTPLMALRLDAEALHDAGEAGHVSADIDALERAVTQSISDARRPAATPAGQDACDAAQVVAERVEFWSVLATETGRDADVDLAAGPLWARLPRADLAALIDALLGNIFAHTPDGTAFTVTLTGRPDGGARLVITDHGPGFPAAAAGELTQRGASGAGSTGLGLDIARRAAQASGGTLALGRAPGGGARVTVDLGPVPAPSRQV
jgi:signal transduction histidine kinase